MSCVKWENIRDKIILYIITWFEGRFRVWSPFLQFVFFPSLYNLHFFIFLLNINSNYVFLSEDMVFFCRKINNSTKIIIKIKIYINSVIIHINVTKLQTAWLEYETMIHIYINEGVSSYFILKRWSKNKVNILNWKIHIYINKGLSSYFILKRWSKNKVNILNWKIKFAWWEPTLREELFFLAFKNKVTSYCSLLMKSFAKKVSDFMKRSLLHPHFLSCPKIKIKVKI